jgi:hypothetical protein
VAVALHPQAFFLDALEAIEQYARFAGVDQRCQPPLELSV